MSTSWDGDDYDARFRAVAATGVPMHGEADFVESLGPGSVLDAGCGTGRVAVELARRGMDVVGADVDVSMILQARAKAPELRWEHADLATVDLGRTFDVVMMAGNVMIFVVPGTEASVVANMALQVAPGGALVTGFQLGRSLTLDHYDAHAAAAGLVLSERWATWDRTPWTESADYAVSVHRPSSF